MKRILACCLALAAVSLTAQAAVDQPHVTVSGKGHIEVVPDTFKIDLSVEQQSQNAATAKQAVDKASSRIIAIARRSGLKQSDIDAMQIYVGPQYDYKQSPPKLLGYQVRRQITLTLHDFSRYDQLLNAAMQAGATRIDNVTASYSKPQLLVERALAVAAEAARAKAKRLARTLGVQLGPVYAVVEQSAPQPRPLMFNAARADAAGPANPPSQPGAVDVDATVQVTFLLSKPRG